MNTKLICRILIILALFSLLVACDSSAPIPQKKKELLIYCGITMEKPIRELAESFEQQENCIVKIMIGGSGTLYRIIEVNQVGDLYLPGSESYINKTFASGSTIQTKLVGYNRAALVVAKGNPLEISPNISNLTSNEYRVVLGSPDSGSIGKETKNILSRFDLYEQAVDNSLFLTSDSKGLRQAIVENTANLALNWYATTVWQENKDHVEELHAEMEAVAEKVTKEQKDSLKEGNNMEVKETKELIIGVGIIAESVISATKDGFQGKDVDISIFNAFAPLIHFGALQTIAAQLNKELLLYYFFLHLINGTNQMVVIYL
jgi:molybdate transport system substrate-binding protein